MKCLAAILSVLLAATTLSAADITGEWEFTAKVLNDFAYGRFNLKAEGKKLSGNLNELKLEGAIKADVLTFKGTRSNGQLFADFKGTLTGDQLHGTASWPNITGDVTWSARRAPKPPAKPQVHEFEPREFHRVFSDAIPPVLHIFPGDTVKTWTVDAGGYDSKGVRRSAGGNPETGPFYIEGADPGDTLETSMDVEFTVELIKGQATAGPRSENGEYVMSSGIGNSLTDALQIATTQLANWLQKDYRLEPNEAAIVLGTTMRYDIADDVDPLVHVVAKIRKDALALLK